MMDCLGASTRGGRKKRVLRRTLWWMYTTYDTYGDSIMKPTKVCLKGEEEGKEEWEYNGRGELVQLALYMCMKYHNGIIYTFNV
jgi:hypothetical protein